ncbi:MAG: ribonuclease III domain-containing protein [Ruminococcus sp.]|nr:ribonuclease III domain-containing protein [Ruminococcus sp.]
MSTILNTNSDMKQYSPNTLAFIGDTVYELFVRESLVTEANRPVNELNKRKVSLVNCEAQAEAVRRITPSLTDEELSVYKRGRNAFTKNTPKNSSVADYHSATGLEALFGYLYLSGRVDRLRELFEIVIGKSE